MILQRSFLLSIFLISFLWNANAQRKVEYSATGYQEKVGRGDDSFIRLVQNVRFDIKDDNTIITGDSSLYYDKQGVMIVYGRVKVQEGDSITITSRRLNYLMQEKRAEFRQNVVFNDGKMTLTTNYLDYFTDTRDARYYNNGKIVDDENILTSREGDVNNLTHKINFRGEVVLVTPDYTLESERLVYDRITKVAVTPTFTKTTLKDGEIVYADDGGTYVTDRKQVTYKSGKIDTEDYEIFGDDLFFDDIRQLSTAKGNVILVSKEDDLVIFGDHAISSKEKGYTKVWGNTLLMKPFETDTLFLTADTLKSVDADIDSLKRILAFNKVKFYKTDLQGIADSLAYFNADSILHFYQDPVMWNEKSQMVADTIKAHIKNSTIERILMRHNSFVISEDTVANHNQIKGRNMTALFVNDQMDKLLVEGNAESIYFVLDEEDDFYFVGMNRIICSDMQVIFIDGEIDNYSAYVKPDAKFIPPHELNEPERRLPGYAWRPKERPKREDVVSKENRLDFTQRVKQHLKPDRENEKVVNIPEKK